MENNLNEAIEVFTEEQLTILPKETKESIVFLEKNLPAEHVKLFNPLVSELLKIKEFEKIEYVADSKESIAQYKEAKKAITAFKKKAGETKTAIKKPLDTIGSEVLGIEKGVKKIAEDILAILSTKFKPYEDAEEARRKAAADKKREADQKVINDLTAEQKQQQDQMLKSNMLNTFKYEKAMPWETKVNEALENYSLDSLNELANKLAEANANNIYTGFRSEARDLIDRFIITDDEYIAAVNMYKTKIESLIKRVADKIALLKTLEDNKTLKTTNEVISNFGNLPVGEAINFPQEPAVAHEIKMHPEEMVAQQPMEQNHPVEISMDDIPFMVAADNPAGLDINQEIQYFKARLNQLDAKYVALYNEAQTRPGIDQQEKQMKKLSACIVLIRKIVTYIEQ